jgi:hypothetical protein
MKTDRSRKNLKIPVLTPLVVVIAVFIIHPASAVTITHDLVITENSSTDLTATYDGTPVTVISTPSPDNWGVLLPFNAGFNALVFEWYEPGSGLVNGILADPPTSRGTPLEISSDMTYFGQVVAVADETTITNAGTDLRDNGSISLTFDDDGDVLATVPDKGSTFTLLCLSSIALFAGTRFRRLPTA